MKRIVIAGQDRTEEMLAALSAGEGAPPATPTPPGLGLATSTSEADYLARLLELLRTRDGLHTRSFDVPSRPGLRGRILRLIRRLQWKVLRFQHDRMAFQQNAINGQIAAALEFLREEQRRDVAKFEARIAALEGKLLARRHDGGIPSRQSLGGKVFDHSYPTDTRTTGQTAGREWPSPQNSSAASGEDAKGCDGGKGN